MSEGVYVSLCGYVHLTWRVLRGWKRSLYPLELELQEVSWVLGDKLMSFVRYTSTFNQRSISPAPRNILFLKIYFHFSEIICKWGIDTCVHYACTYACAHLSAVPSIGQKQELGPQSWSYLR